MSSILRPHRSPSPAPASPPPPNPSHPAKLTRQSLGPPPTTSQGAARGFTGLGISSPTAAGGPRHVSSSVAMGYKETLSPRPTMGGSVQQRAVSHFVRPSSEFLGGGAGRMDSKTPETEQLDQWFTNLSNWESTLEEMAQVSNDQNFTEELGAIEQWFRVLSEAERTAALYSLLQHSTPVQIQFFISVLHHMAQTAPAPGLISPTPQTANANFAAQMDKLAGSAANMKSPSAGGGAGFSAGQYLSADGANGDTKRQNRISAPGTLQPTDRWQSQLDQVAERGGSPGMDSAVSGRSRSPAPETGSRPKSTDFSGLAPGRSPRIPSGNGVGLGFGQPDPVGATALSPLLQGTSWASMVNSPLAPMFQEQNKNLADQLSLASLQLAAQQQAASGKVNLDDARKFRRPGVGPAVGTGNARNVSATYDENGNMIQANSPQPGSGAFPTNLARSPALDQLGFAGLGLGHETSQLNGLGMGFGSPALGGSAAQLLALAQAQQQLQNSTYPSYNNLGFRGGAAPARGTGRRSPMIGKSNSPAPDKTPGGGAGAGAGVAGPDDVDMRVVEDVNSWLRVLRLHKYTTNFGKYKWQDMVMLNDQDLQDNGVSAQGARTKFLKVFYNVRERQGITHPPGQEEYAPNAQSGKE